MQPLPFALIFTILPLFATPRQQYDETLAQKAVAAERRGDFDAAVTAFDELIHNGADSPELRSNLGIAYFQLRDYTNALRQFRLALAKNPDSVPANLFSGLSLLKLQRPKTASVYLERAHRAQPTASETTLALAQAKIALNDTAGAHALYAEATRLDPQNAEAWYGLGITDRALAEQEFEESKRSGPESGSEASTNKSRALMNASEDAINRAMQLDPGSVRARMILGESLRIAERYSEAIREYKAATEQQPGLAPAWAGLATSYSASGDEENALKAAAQALALDPNDADTNALVAAVYLHQGDYAKAKPYAARALEIQPKLSSAHVVLAKIELAEHRPEKALPELEAAAKDDTDGSTYYLLATTLRQLGRREDAAAAMQKYKQLHSMHVAAAPVSR